MRATALSGVATDLHSWVSFRRGRGCESPPAFEEVVVPRPQPSRTDALLENLRAEGTLTWFDLGLLLDRLRDDRRVPSARAPADRRAFRHKLARGVAFVTYEFAIDGVTMEVVKYATALARILPDPEIHFIGGHFDPRVEGVLDPAIDRHAIDGLDCFGSCSLYRSLFNKRLERGSRLYNRLISELWQTTLGIVEQLGRVFEREGIELIFAVNTNSNPGNPALALALVLVSEHFAIPVISNNHDFYWEGGHSEIEREQRGLPRGPRDQFYTNAHLGEVFSVVEMTHPWQGRSWLSLNLSPRQCDRLIGTFGHNPASVANVGTAVDTELFAPLSRPRRVDVLQQIVTLLGGVEHMVPVHNIGAVIEDGLLAEKPHAPMLLGHGSEKRVDFTHDNVILLQPTRIISRKRIGLNFEMLSQLFADPEFAAFFERIPTLKLTVLVTGPVADGQQRYFDQLLELFRTQIDALPASLQDRVFFAPLFAGIDSPDFRRAFEKPVQIAEIYGASSLVCLPSQTEGRGLPIIEAAACGVPALVRRYEPEEVYAHVIGEHLAAEHRLQVVEFQGQRIGRRAVEQVRDLLIHPHDHAELSAHNRRVAEDRYSMAALVDDLSAALDQLWHQMQSSKRGMDRARDALSRFRRRMHGARRRVSDLIHDDHREYLPGYGRMAFMLMLKSLIDPSYFRVEEQRIRGLTFEFARRLVESGDSPLPTSSKAQRAFYNIVESLFLHHDGEMKIMFDHAMAYRHRSRSAYPYRDLTPQELCGVINALHQETCTPPHPVIAPLVRHFSSWPRAMERLCGAMPAIDQRNRLLESLAENRPFACFPGGALGLELELFVLHAVRLRLGLEDHESLNAESLNDAGLAPIHLIVRESPCADQPTVATVKQCIRETPNEELRLIFRQKTCRIVPGRHLAPGIDVRELGQRALTALREVDRAGGFVLACAEQAAPTMDILGLERFVVGRAEDPLAAGLLGIEVGDGFIQWLPPGLRYALAYPTPVQTGKSLARTLESDRFEKLCGRLTEQTVLEALQQDAAERGSPVERVLDALEADQAGAVAAVEQCAIGGLYDDRQPWSGNLAKARPAAGPLRFYITSSATGPRTVVDFVGSFEAETRETALIAWNGGYILNAELVGKLGLPETYIGSPLGLIVSEGKVLSPPLYAKPAFIVEENGRLSIRRVSAAGGLRMTSGNATVEFDADAHNPETPPDGACYYDLLFTDNAFPGDGRTLVRLAGARIMEIVESKPGANVPVFPVGLTLSFPAGAMPTAFAEGVELAIELPALSGVVQAVEAGPLLVEGGAGCIDMEREGWSTANSIRTQAARLDFLDMRGPKIAVGLDAEGNLTVLTVNGRIRESVGATHVDMAEIMQSLGLESAMGFDPGGSSTLVVRHETVNISPYNPEYERNVWSLPPQPRGVSNVVIGY